MDNCQILKTKQDYYNQIYHKLVDNNYLFEQHFGIFLLQTSLKICYNQQSRRGTRTIFSMSPHVRIEMVFNSNKSKLCNLSTLHTLALFPLSLKHALRTC